MHRDVNFYDTLILVTTYRCNFDCIYCPVPKARKSISSAIARQAVSFFGSNSRLNKVRFFGGEPLLKFNVVQDVIGYAQKIFGNHLNFDITTNGSLLDRKVLDFIGDNPKIELILSIDGDSKTQAINKRFIAFDRNPYNALIDKLPDILKLPLVTVNMVAAPNQVKLFFNNFKHVLSLGFRRFNFLPAYYLLWKDKELKILEREFGKIAEFILNSDIDIYVKNIDVYSPTPLFNRAVVVDYNGDIFPNNLILSSRFSYLRDRIKIGNIKKPETGLFKKCINVSQLIKRESDNDFLKSTRHADAVLTGFVEKIRHEKNRC